MAQAFRSRSRPGDRLGKGRRLSQGDGRHAGADRRQSASHSRVALGKGAVQGDARGHDNDLTIRPKYFKNEGSVETANDPAGAKDGTGSDVQIFFGEASI